MCDQLVRVINRLHPYSLQPLMEWNSTLPAARSAGAVAVPLECGPDAVLPSPSHIRLQDPCRGDDSRQGLWAGAQYPAPTMVRRSSAESIPSRCAPDMQPASVALWRLPPRPRAAASRDVRVTACIRGGRAAAAETLSGRRRWTRPGPAGWSPVRQVPASRPSHLHPGRRGAFGAGPAQPSDLG